MAKSISKRLDSYIFWEVIFLRVIFLRVIFCVRRIHRITSQKITYQNYPQENYFPENYPQENYFSENYAFSSVNPKVVPCPTVLRTVIVCLWASMMCLAMLRPRPVPPASRERCLSIR